MTHKHIITIGIALFTATGCSSFEPDLGTQSTGFTGTSDTGAETDGSTGEDTVGTAGSTGAETDGGSTGEGGSTGGGNTSPDVGGGSTGGETQNPQPGGICDPFLAFMGIAPCDGDPNEPIWDYTCVPAQTEPLPGEPQWDFRCVKFMDSNVDGGDIGDVCSDNAGKIYQGCMNSHCTGNGLGNNPETDEYINHPPGACPFGSAETSYVKGCCTPFCDADNPCDTDWHCNYVGGLPIDDVGYCIWNG